MRYLEYSIKGDESARAPHTSTAVHHNGSLLGAHALTECAHEPESNSELTLINMATVQGSKVWPLLKMTILEEDI